MKTDQILDIAVKSIKSAMPEAIFQGSLVKNTRAFNPSTNSVTLTPTTIDVEVIFDTFTSNEALGSSIKVTDLKLHIIANELTTLDFYSLVNARGGQFKIKQVIDSVVGTKSAIFTIIAEK